MSLHTVKQDYKTTKLQREQLHGHKALFALVYRSLWLWKIYLG